MTEKNDPTKCGHHFTPKPDSSRSVATVIFNDAKQIDELSTMLETVLDAHYGTALHHIGDGDGIDSGDASKLRAWWECRIRAKKSH